MQSDRNDHLNGIRSASEELGDNDGTESELQELSDGSGDETARAEGSDSDDYLDNPQKEPNEGEWQDWKCQQPLQKDPLHSPLCNACIHLFRVYQPLVIRIRYGMPNGMSEVPSWFRFLATLQALQLSARSGCAFCKLISAAIRDDSPGFEPAETVKIKFQVFTDPDQWPELIFTYMGRISPKSTATRSETKLLNLLHGIRIRLRNLFCLYKLMLHHRQS